MYKWLTIVGIGLLVLAGTTLMQDTQEDIPFDVSYSITHFSNDDYLFGRYSNNLGTGTTFERRSQFAHQTKQEGISFFRNSLIREIALSYYQAAGLRHDATEYQSRLGFERNRKIAETKHAWDKIVQEGYAR